MKEEYVNLATIVIPIRLIKNFPQLLIAKYQCLPVFREGDMTTLAFAESPAPEVVENIEKALGSKIKVVLTDKAKLQQYINRFIAEFNKMPEEYEKIIRETKTPEVKEIKTKQPANKLIFALGGVVIIMIPLTIFLMLHFNSNNEASRAKIDEEVGKIREEYAAFKRENILATLKVSQIEQKNSINEPLINLLKQDLQEKIDKIKTYEEKNAQLFQKNTALESENKALREKISSMSERSTNRPPSLFGDILNMSEEVKQWSRDQKLSELLKAGKLSEAKEILMAELNEQPNNPSTLYNLACVHSRMGNKSEALNYLEKAFNAGFNNVGHMKQDTDLDNIRNEERFKKLIERR